MANPFVSTPTMGGSRSSSDSDIAFDDKQDATDHLLPKQKSLLTVVEAGSSNTSLSTTLSNVAAKEPPVTWMSLPNKPQLFILAICRLSEPLSNTCLLPYLYYLIRSTQAEHNTQTISVSAGLLVATFALAQFATSMLWAKIADRFGRKKVILVGLFTSIIANIGFGLSRGIIGLMVWRTIAGIANGNIGVMRTMTAEIVKERKFQSRAFLLLPLVFNTGNIFGLFLGGILAMPVKNWPGLFGKDGVFNFAKGPEGVQWMVKYPFLLPTIGNACMLICGLVLAVGWLKETSEGKGEDLGLAMGKVITRTFKGIFPCLGRRSGYAMLQSDDVEQSSVGASRPKGGPPAPTGPPPSIWTRQVLTTLIPFTLLPLHNATFMQLFPLFLSSPPAPNTTSSSPIFFTGGLGLSTSTIGVYLSAFGCSGIFLQLFIYPRLQARFGTLNILRTAFVLFPITYILTPYVIKLPNFPLRAAGTAFVLFLQVMARTLAIPSTVILLTNAAPEKRVLGTVHGVGNMMSSFSRAVGPALGGCVSAWGIKQGSIGVVWWGYLSVIAVIGILSTSFMGEEEKMGNQQQQQSPPPAIALTPVRKRES